MIDYNKYLDKSALKASSKAISQRTTPKKSSPKKKLTSKNKRFLKVIGLLK